MLNIGLEVLSGRNTTKSGVVSMESILEQYTSCEEFFSNTDRMCSYGDQLFTAFDNIISLGKAACKYGKSTEGLAVINELVKNDFHGCFSIEVAQGYADTLWGKIKAFFAKIWNWLKMFFQKIISLFSNTKDRLIKLRVALEALQKKSAKIKEWRYIGIKPVEMKLVERHHLFLDKLNACKDAEAVDTLISGYFKGDDTRRGVNASGSFEESTIVRDINGSLAIINPTIKMLDDVGDLKKDAEKSYNAAKNKAENMSKKATEADVIAAKLEMKKTSGEVKWLTKMGKAATRSAMSILANCKAKEA